MPLSFDDVYNGIRDAESTIHQFENRIDRMANLISGKLRAGKVSGFILSRLKRELKDYNMATGKWKKT